MAIGEGGTLAVLASVALGSLVLAVACQSPVRPDGGRYRHAPSGASVVDPGPPWRPVAVEGATVALQGPGGSAMTWIHACRDALPPARLLARGLLVGLEDVALRESREAPVLGGPGWALDATARDRARHVRIVARIRRDERCHDDFVWIGPAGATGAPPAFDAFWRSFERDGTAP